jgi:phage baseplate assembly protein gpV
MVALRDVGDRVLVLLADGGPPAAVVLGGLYGADRTDVATT